MITFSDKIRAKQLLDEISEVSIRVHNYNPNVMKNLSRTWYISFIGEHINLEDLEKELQHLKNLESQLL